MADPSRGEIWLADLGRREEGLAAIQEATTIRRELAAARADEFRSDLARSLDELATAQAGLREAEAAVEERSSRLEEAQERVSELHAESARKLPGFPC